MIYTNSIIDSNLSLAKGDIQGHSVINKFGRNSDIDVGNPGDIWDGGSIYIPPTTDTTHDIVSDSTDDGGSKVLSSTTTGGTTTTLEDENEVFDGGIVLIGDIVLIDGTQDHSIVIEVTKHILTIKPLHHSTDITSQPYRIVRPEGSGGAVLHIKQGFQQDGTEQSEFIILDGDKVVSTLNKYFRITRAHIHGVGVNGSNVGTITITAQINDTITAQINPNNGQTLMAFYHIPIGKSGYLTNLNISMNRQGSVSGAMADLTMRTRLWGDVGEGEVIKNSMSVAIDGGTYIKNYTPYMKINQGTDIWVRCENVTDNNTDISVSFDLILVDN